MNTFHVSPSDAASSMAPTINPPIATPISIASTSGSRSRVHARKKPSDDAAYFGPPGSAMGTGSTAGAKRHAADKAEGEPRVKRKRVEAGTSTGARKSEREKDRERDRLALDADSKMSLVKFSSMPTAALHRYLVQFDLVPMVYPSPLTIEDPPPPFLLERTRRPTSRGPSPTVATPANRPRRESKESQRRSARLVDEEAQSRAPVLSDVDDVHKVLSVMVERHFREHSVLSGREEVEILAGFMCKLKKGTRL